MFDTHCHLTFREFTGRVPEVMARAAEVGVTGAISIATTAADSVAAGALAASMPNIWSTAGVHPLYSAEPADWAQIKAAGAQPKCVAWGELGLDNHHADPPASVQRSVLDEQLALIERCMAEDAARFDKPAVIHCREAFDDVLAVLKSGPFRPERCVFHCFTGTPAEARKILDFGAWISFTGVVTFANATDVADAAKLVPLDRMMVETDAPFLAPEPVRKVRPNEPKHVVHVARRLAELRGLPYEAMEERLDANAERFFGIKLP